MRSHATYGKLIKNPFMNSEGSIHNQISWHNKVQSSVNRIVFHCSSTSVTTFEFLKKVSVEWEDLKKSTFYSERHFYLVLVPLMDHLLKWFLVNKMSAELKKIDSETMLFIEGSQETSSFAIQKMMVGVTEPVFEEFCIFVSIYCKYKFGRKPTVIEVYDLLHEKKFIWREWR
ncbi:hypothetical protein ACERJO_01395 [Halalkalibacter sp. AB-rgal2]|uniref:hypothetical protein n=1 Tax=Halalkalibacter sp. AB-rgal2 TaxID=3242695 RepID=UPI00359CD1E1